MRKNRLLLYFAVCMAIGFVGLLSVLQMQEQDQIPFSLSVVSGAESEKVVGWDAGAGTVYFFLPGYAELSDTFLCLETEMPVRINGSSAIDGMCFEGFEWNKTYESCYSSWGKEQRHSIVFVQSGNVPSLYVNTESGKMDYVHTSKNNEESGSVRLYTADGKLNYDGLMKNINGRGNSTWSNPKKPYAIKLEDEADLLGMGAAQKWILLANANDPTHLKNKIVYDIAAEAGLPYSPRSEWIDLYLNGEYAGLYLLCERNEIHLQRVNLPEETGTLISMELLTRMKDEVYVTTHAGQTLRIRHPSNPNSERKEILETKIQMLEDAILAEDESYLEWIDLDSWVRRYLVEEIFANCDGCYVSQYFYFDEAEEDGKIYAGPVWDYDNTLSYENEFQLHPPYGLSANREYVRQDFQTPWFHALYQKEAFRNRVVELYQEDFLPAIEELLSTRMAAYAQVIQKAVSVNQLRWNLREDPSAEVEEMTRWLSDRRTFLNSLWLEGEEYCQVRADIGLNRHYSYYAVKTGECLELPVLENKDQQIFLGWFYEETGKPYDSNRPITEDIAVCSKWEGMSSRWLRNNAKYVFHIFFALMLMTLMIADRFKTKKKGWRK